MRLPIDLTGKLSVLILCLLLLTALMACGGEAPPEPPPENEVIDSDEAGADEPEADIISPVDDETEAEAVDRQVAAVLEEIGGLAYNEAYQFILEDGRYVLLSGRRLLESIEEVRRYYPDIDLPEQMGDYRFQYFATVGTLTESVWVGGDGPFQQSTHRVLGTVEEDLPLNEILVRDLYVLLFYGMYENSAGDRVTLTVMGGDHGAACDCIVYDGLHFRRNPWDETEYGGVSYLPQGQDLLVFLAIIDNENPGEIAGEWLSYHPLFRSFDEFLTLAETFDLPGLWEQHQWRIDRVEDISAIWISSMCWV